MDIPSSSRSDSHARKHSKDHHHKKHKKRRSRSRSRSRSISYSPPKKRSSMVYVNPAITRGLSSSMIMSDKTKNEYEMRCHALGLQLQVANERISSIEQDLRSAKYGQHQAEQKLSGEVAEKQTLQNRNHEILAIMNTLQLGCEALQRDKMDIEIKVEKINEEKEILVKEKKDLKEQNDFMTQRNLTLVKKCETVCEENKTLKSKLEEVENDLKSFRPNMEKMEAELTTKRAEFSKMAEKLVELEKKEVKFESDKRELELKLENKETAILSERKSIEDWRKSQIATRIDLQRKLDALGPHIERIEHMRNLEKLVKSLQQHYESELTKLKKQLSILESSTLPTGIGQPAPLRNQRAGSAPPAANSNWGMVKIVDLTEENQMNGPSSDDVIILNDDDADILLSESTVIKEEKINEEEIETLLNGDT